MLRVYPSNKTESLAIVMAELMKAQPLSDPFVAETILIQSHGMGTWLKQQLSSDLGIAAMIETMMPASYVWQLVQSLLPSDETKALVPQFEKLNLRWEIFERLPEHLNSEGFEQLRHYLFTLCQLDPQADIAALDDAKLFQLSEMLADIFDAYQNYRADWIDAWELGEGIPNEEIRVRNSASETGRHPIAQELEAWQATLWRSLYPSLSVDERRHRSNQLAKLNAFLAQETLPKGVLPERIFVFGLSALPPQWLPLFLNLGRHCEVHLLIQNPCQLYWGDVLSELQQMKLEQSMVEKGVSAETAGSSFIEANPLLASWGKLGRDYLSLLYQYDEAGGLKELDLNLFEDPVASEASLNDMSPTGESLSESSALNNLQHDLLKLHVERRVVNASDNSIRFARCHSRLREVEALRDYLLDLLDSQSSRQSITDKPILAKDIIVMMPDVQDFAALIDAVFSRPVACDNGPSQILAYGISDQTLALDQPLIDVFIAILGMANLRISATEVLDWLDIPAIRERFGIEEAQLTEIHRWLDALSIRWGLSEAHRDQVVQTQGSGQGNTWLAAFKRVGAAYVLGELETEEQTQLGILPFAIEGTDNQALMGNLMHFIEVIESTQTTLSGQQTVDDWLSTLVTLWHRWFDIDALDEAVRHLMDQVIQQTSEQIAISDFDRTVRFTVVANAISAQFQKERVSQRFLAGRINFCTLMPMRSIPFKVVCMLGMNEGHYPRPENKVSFDLLSITPPRMGDRSRREDDRYLFLEALCSVRDFLYISYCGYDAQDNSERFPSVLVSEFRDYCAKYFYVATDCLDAGHLVSEPTDRVEIRKQGQALLSAWTRDHRLQSFHEDYYLTEEFATTAQQQTYSRDWLALYQTTSLEADGSEKNSAPENVEADETNDAQVLELDVMVGAFNNPLRFYYRHGLELSDRDFDLTLDDTEPFSLSGLSAYQLKQSLAQTWYDDELSTDNVLSEWQLSGQLPRAPVDIANIASLEGDLVELKNYVDDYAPFERESFSVVIDGVELKGEVSLSMSQSAHSKGLIEFSLSKSFASQFFGFWLRHVVWNLYLNRKLNRQLNPHSAGTSRIISSDFVGTFPALTAEQSEAYARELLEFYQSLSTRPVNFLPRTAYSQLFETLSKARTTFYGSHAGYFRLTGECEDLFWRRACTLGGLSPQDPDQYPDFSEQILIQQIATHLEQQDTSDVDRKGKGDVDGDIEGHDIGKGRIEVKKR